MAIDLWNTIQRVQFKIMQFIDRSVLLSTLYINSNVFSVTGYNAGFLHFVCKIIIQLSKVA